MAACSPPAQSLPTTGDAKIALVSIGFAYLALGAVGCWFLGAGGKSWAGNTNTLTWVLAILGAVFTGCPDFSSHNARTQAGHSWQLCLPAPYPSVFFDTKTAHNVPADGYCPPTTTSSRSEEAIAIILKDRAQLIGQEL